MPFTPTPPYPKTAGAIIRSADWNAVVTEVQRLDTDKVNRAGADAMSGPLTIAGALAVGTATPAAAARLHVVGPTSPTVLRIQSTTGFGAARLEMWSDAQGGPSEWRPAYIESTDAGTFTGGLAFVTNGSGGAQRTGAVEAMRVVNGRLGIGVTAPGYRLDVSDRIRLRQGTPAAYDNTAGLWLYQQGTATDRAFIGMGTDNYVGMFGAVYGGWGLNMDVTHGGVGVRMWPSSAYALTVSGPTNLGGTLRVSGNTTVVGRVSDNKVRAVARVAGSTSTSGLDNTTSWVAIAGMSLSIVAPTGGADYLIRFNMNGVQATISNAPPHGLRAQAEFRLLIDGALRDYTVHEFHGNGWELRGVCLERLMSLPAGSHTIIVEWSIKSPDARPVGTPAFLYPERLVTLTGGWYNDARCLHVIEL